MTELLLKEKVYATIGAAIEVHKQLGSGFLEAVYHEAMEIETSLRGIPAQNYVPLEVRYKGHVLQKRMDALRGLNSDPPWARRATKIPFFVTLRVLRGSNT